MSVRKASPLSLTVALTVAACGGGAGPNSAVGTYSLCAF